MEDPTDEIRRLHRCINDLVSVLTVPEISTGQESSRIVTTLLETLVGMLRLDFVYARTRGSEGEAPLEVVRLAEGRNSTVDPSEVRRVLGSWLSRNPPSSRISVPNPVAAGDVFLATFPLGLADELGSITAASQRSDFPTKIEIVLLRVAANRAAIGLQQARLLSEQKRTSAEPEQKVAERTRQLLTINQALLREITERERLQEEQRKLASLVERDEANLREVNERVEMILDSITDNFFAVDFDWRYTYFNQHAEKQLRSLGKNPASMIGKVLWDEFPNPSSGQQLRRAMRERTVVNHEHYFAPLGQWLDNRIYPSPDGGLAIFQRYVTDRKRVEEALRQSEERFRLMVENIEGYAIFMLDADGRIITWNAGAEHMNGYQGEEVIGKSFSIFYTEEGIEQDLPERGLEAAAREGRFEGEGWRLRKDGTRFWASVVITAIRDEQRTLVGFSKITHDLTERKKAEEELRRSEAYLQEGQRISHAGSWAWNVSTGELFWSLEHFRICGVDPDTFKPTLEAARQLIHPDDFLSLDEAFNRATIEGRDFEWNFRIVRPDGTIRDVHSVSHPVFDNAGNLTEYVGALLDITERKLTEETLRNAHAELAHATRLTTIGELTASIAHEVNQPLGAIVANGNATLRLLSRDEPDIEGAREAVECMIADGMRSSEVTKKIRALLKKTVPEKALLNINEVILDVIGLTSGELAKNQITLQTQLDTAFADVLGDRIQLQQVLLNLILNGNEAMSVDGWQPRELLIKSEYIRPEEVTVTVGDSGPGFDTRDAERIFDAFFSTKEGGLGLGLSISRTILQAHGGKLWATSSRDFRTMFKFTLPIAN